MMPPTGRRRIVCLAAVLLGLCFGIAVRDGVAQPLPHHDLLVRLDPTARQLVVEDTIVVKKAGQVEFTLARRFAVERILVDGAAVVATPRHVQGQPTRWHVPLGGSTKTRTIMVRYQGRLEPLPEADHRDVLHGLPPMAHPDGSFLPSGAGWYPEIGSGPFTYRVSLDLPASQRGLVPGRLVEERAEGSRYHATFTFAHPAEGIDLIAGPYQVRERIAQRAGGDPIRYRTYFHPEIADLADEYLSAMGGYVDLYSRWIGPYPFTEFSVVSSPLPTGFGMPTLTYLGVRVLRLPFIRQTSLGHEILHNWWGNGVYVDYASGNWSEGLTAFMADYTYKEREGEDSAREARLGLLRDVAAVPRGQDTPLRRFTSRTHGTSQIVGYHKGTFVFLMLRDLLGPVAFDEGLRRFWRDHQFRRASWTDLRRAFEQTSGRNLDRFFEQWLSRRGAPLFTIESAHAEREDSGYRIRVTLAQTEPAYAATVPVVVTTSTGREERPLEITTGRQEFVLEVSDRPLSLTLDPDFRLLRHLDAAELPPILRQVILDPATVTVVATPDESVRATAMDLARDLLDHGVKLADPAAASAGMPLVVIGLAADVDRFLERHGLPGRPARLRRPGTAHVWTAFQPSGKVLAVISAESVDALWALLRPLPHYGRQSYLIFDGARAVERGIWPAQLPTWRFTEENR
jgi:hypothetical protein